MNLEKVTRKLAEALNQVIVEAEKNSNPEQTEEHLIYTIFLDADGMIEILCRELNLNREDLLSLSKKAISKLPKVQNNSSNMQIHPSSSLIQLLTKSDSYRQTWKDDYLSTEHILYSFLKDSNSNLKLEFNQKCLNH
jgi:ATP-dependent Clp protease ATP-binding subunit ClpB